MIRFFDGDGIDVAEATQRKIERLYHREEFRRVLAWEIGDIDFPPRALEQYTGALMGVGRRRGHRRRRVQAGPRLLLRHGQLRHAQRPGQAGGRGPGGQPLRATAADGLGRPGRPRPPGWPTWSGPRGPTLGAVIDPDGEHITLVDGEGRVLTDDEALLSCSSWSVDTPRRPGGPARGGAGRPSRSAPRPTPRSSGPSSRPPTSWRWPAPAGSTFAASQIGRLHLPQLPPRLRRRRHPGPPARPCWPPPASP